MSRQISQKKNNIWTETWEKQEFYGNVEEGEGPKKREKWTNSEGREHDKFREPHIF